MTQLSNPETINKEVINPQVEEDTSDSTPHPIFEYFGTWGEDADIDKFWKDLEDTRKKEIDRPIEL